MDQNRRQFSDNQSSILFAGSTKYDDIILDKIEFCLNRNILKDHEKIFNEAGLTNLPSPSTWELITELFRNIMPG